MDIHAIYAPISRFFRVRRMRRFQEMFAVTGETRILDVGGYLANWKLIPTRPRLTILNLVDVPRDEAGRGDARWIIGDGCYLPFPDQSFDIAYSNSVIEHLGTIENQRRFAAEIARVRVRYFIETPNRWFPVEPHYLTPFVHFLPARWRQRIIGRFTIWGAMTHPTEEKCARMVGEIRLLDQ